MPETLTPLVPGLIYDAHEHDEHHDHQHHDDHEPVISQRWKWMTVLGNAAIGAAELATGNFSTMSVTSDGLHNVGDTATYYMQAENILDKKKSEKKRQQLRKIAHWMIAATSLGVTVKAGIDLALDQESAPHAATMYAAGASLALNGVMLARLRKGVRRKKNDESVYEHDLSKHFWAVDIPSAALAVAGAGLQKYNVNVEQVLAAASGIVGAYAFRPTKANMAHNCLDQSHSHEHSKHPIASKKSWLQRMRYQPRHGQERGGHRRLRVAAGLGVTALALMGGLLTGDTQHEDAVHAPKAPGSAATQVPTLIKPEVQQPPRQESPLSLTECITIAPNDTQWDIVERRITDVVGREASVPAINAITMFTAIKNEANFPDPGVIHAGECLQVPTTPAIREMYGAIDGPGLLADPILVKSIKSFNEQPDMRAVLANDAGLSVVESSLQRVLAT
jgi:hypothetical protein